MECESSSLVLLFYPVNCLSPGATGYYQAVSREGGGYNCVYPMSSRVEADCEHSGGLSSQNIHRSECPLESPGRKRKGLGRRLSLYSSSPRGFGTGEVGGGWPVTPPASSAPRAAGLLHLTYTPESPSSTAPSRVYQSWIKYLIYIPTYTFWKVKMCLWGFCAMLFSRQRRNKGYCQWKCIKTQKMGIFYITAMVKCKLPCFLSLLFPQGITGMLPLSQTHHPTCTSLLSKGKPVRTSLSTSKH